MYGLRYCGLGQFWLRRMDNRTMSGSNLALNLWIRPVTEPFVWIPSQKYKWWSAWKTSLPSLSWGCSTFRWSTTGGTDLASCHCRGGAGRRQRCTYPCSKGGKWLCRPKLWRLTPKDGLGRKRRPFLLERTKVAICRLCDALNAINVASEQDSSNLSFCFFLLSNISNTGARLTELLPATISSMGWRRGARRWRRRLRHKHRNWPVPVRLERLLMLRRKSARKESLSQQPSMSADVVSTSWPQINGGSPSASGASGSAPAPISCWTACKFAGKKAARCNGVSPWQSLAFASALWQSNSCRVTADSASTATCAAVRRSLPAMFGSANPCSSNHKDHLRQNFKYP